jgi:uridine kinase
MNIDELTQAIIHRRSEVPAERSMLVGISGIDASGKGFITAKIADSLKERCRTAVINVDGWLNLPHVRFDQSKPAENFYENALRLDDMFDRLIEPLKADRGVEITVDFAEETAAEFRRHRYEFESIDIILLEGIFIFKRQFVRHFDFKIWIDCSFATALSRAIERSQEGLSAEETVIAYDTIYFPAQRLHLRKDEPQGSADIIFANS